MNDNIKPKSKLGVKGNTIITTIFIVVLLFLLFGGKGSNTADLNGYATTFDANNPGAVKIFDIGARSKVAIIRHEDGSLSGIAFRKIPFLDRWKVTHETVPYDAEGDKSVWITVDDGFKEYFIISDGEKLTVEKNRGYYGIYSSILSNTALGLVIFALVNLVRRLWKRRNDKKTIGSIPG
jgi:hypothetical protein